MSSQPVPFSQLPQAQQDALVDSWVLRDAAVRQAQRDYAAAQLAQAQQDARLASYWRPQ